MLRMTPLNSLKQCLDDTIGLCDELLTQRLFAGRTDPIVLAQLRRRLADANRLAVEVFFF